MISRGSGGDEGIRTLDGLMTHTPLAGERLRPLGHVSERGTSDSAAAPQPLMHVITVRSDFRDILTINSLNLYQFRTTRGQ